MVLERRCSRAQVWCEFDAISTLVHWHVQLIFLQFLFLEVSPCVCLSVCLRQSPCLRASCVSVRSSVVNSPHRHLLKWVSVGLSQTVSLPVCVSVLALWTVWSKLYHCLSVLVLWTACRIKIASVSVRFKPSQCLYLFCEHEAPLGKECCEVALVAGITNLLLSTHQKQIKATFSAVNNPVHYLLHVYFRTACFLSFLNKGYTLCSRIIGGHSIIPPSFLPLTHHPI